MQVNINKAINTLRSVDNQLRAQIKTATPPGQSKDGDSVEIGGTGRSLSSGYVQLQSELSDQLSSLTSLIGDSSERQNELAGLFGDAGNEDEVRARAQELLEGYFNVENTGDRIFDFAMSFYDGSDRESFAREMQGYIHEGFAQAEKQLGGLADISLETRDYIDKRIDNFIDEGKEDGGTTEVTETEAEETEEPATEKQERLQGREQILADLGNRYSIPDV